MTCDLISRAEARIAEINQQRMELDYEQYELETALKVLHRFLDETASDAPFNGEITASEPSNSAAESEFDGDLITTTEPQPSPAAQTGADSVLLASASAGQASVESSASISDTTAPRPPPEGQGDSAAAPIATDGEFEQQPAEAKTVEEEPLSNGSAGVQDRCESTPAPPSQTKASTDGGATAQVDEPKEPADSVTGDASRERPAPGPECNVDKGDVTAGETAPSISSSPVTLTPTIAPNAPTQRQIFERAIAEHPDWPARIIAERTGLKYSTVKSYASVKKLKLPSQAEWNRATRAEPPAEPVQAAKPVSGAQVQPEAKQPSTVVSSAPVRLVQPRPMQKPSASARFYVIDKQGRFLHQSLQRSPTDDGPLMTSNKAWAWYDNAQRFEGAAKKWPEILEMRREAPKL